MIYVALLRGINVGGKNRVEMARLKNTFEELGHTDVLTYINSGNIIFRSDDTNQAHLENAIEAAIRKDFKLDIHVVLRTIDSILEVSKAAPKSWSNDNETKTDVIFLWEDIDSPDILSKLIIKPGIDTVKYVPGAVLWHVKRADVNKSGLLKIVGTDLYKNMTIRNINTLRKLESLMGNL